MVGVVQRHGVQVTRWYAEDKREGTQRIDCEHAEVKPKAEPEAGSQESTPIKPPHSDNRWVSCPGVSYIHDPHICLFPAISSKGLGLSPSRPPPIVQRVCACRKPWGIAKTSGRIERWGSNKSTRRANTTVSGFVHRADEATLCACTHNGLYLPHAPGPLGHPLGGDVLDTGDLHNSGREVWSAPT